MIASTRIAELKKMQDDYKLAVKSQAAELVKGAVQELFENAPTLQTVYWTQYTPYFNDGEPCHFRTGDMYFSRKAYTREDALGYGDEMDEMVNSSAFDYVDNPTTGEYEEVPRTPDTDGPACDEFAKLFGDSDDILLNAFGDHVSVLITRAGISVEEYSHD